MSRWALRPFTDRATSSPSSSLIEEKSALPVTKLFYKSHENIKKILVNLITDTDDDDRYRQNRSLDQRHFSVPHVTNGSVSQNQQNEVIAAIWIRSCEAGHVTNNWREIRRPVQRHGLKASPIGVDNAIYSTAVRTR